LKNQSSYCHSIIFKWYKKSQELKNIVSKYIQKFKKIRIWIYLQCVYYNKAGILKKSHCIQSTDHLPIYVQNHFFYAMVYHWTKIQHIPLLQWPTQWRDAHGTWRTTADRVYLYLPDFFNLVRFNIKCNH